MGKGWALWTSTRASTIAIEWSALILDLCFCYTDSGFEIKLPLNKVVLQTELWPTPFIVATVIAALTQHPTTDDVATPSPPSDVRDHLSPSLEAKKN